MKIKIEELTSVGCSMCAAAQKTLEGEIKKEFPEVETEYIEFLSPRGQEFREKYDIFFLPGIIVNDELFSFGGLDKDKLRKKLEELRAA